MELETNAKHNAAQEKNGEEQQETSVIERVLKTRKIVISSTVNAKLAKQIINQLLILEKEGDQPISIFINSPGGEIYSGFAIFDMMQFIKPVVKTVVMGFAASMGSILALGATEGERYALPNAMFLIHQPLISGVYQGSVSEIEIQAKEMINTKNRIIQLYTDKTGKSFEDVKKDIDRDFWMTADKALEYGTRGLIDKVIRTSSELNIP